MISRRRVLETMAAALAAARPWAAARSEAAPQTPAQTAHTVWPRDRPLSAPLLAAQVQKPDREEPRVPIEHRRAIRQLRRLG